MARLIIKLTQVRLTGEKETNFNPVHCLIEMGPKKWPKQAVFTLLDKETVNLWGVDRTKKLRLWVLSEESKQRLGLG